MFYDLNHTGGKMTPLSAGPFNFLDQIPEFHDLPKSDLNYLLSKSFVLEMQDNEVIFSKGDKSDFFYFVIEGKVSMGGCSQNGQESTTCIARKKEMFCCLPALDMNPYPVTAVSSGPSKIIRIPTKVFHEICLRHPMTYQKFVNRVCSILRDVVQRHNRRMESAASRISALLISLNEKNNHPIRLTRAEIAKMVGVTVETSIRTLSLMNKQKIIESSRSVIKILDKDKLSGMAGTLADVRTEAAQG